VLPRTPWEPRIRMFLILCFSVVLWCRVWWSDGLVIVCGAMRDRKRERIVRFANTVGVIVD
jgi:hypothetical protein